MSIEVILILFFLIVLYGVGATLWARLLTTSKSTQSMIIWSLWLLLLPPFGIPLYALLGTDRIREKRLKMHVERDQSEPKAAVEIEKETIPDLLKYIGSIEHNAGSALSNPVLFPDASDYFEELLRRIEEAKEYILFQVYLWRPDEVGKKFLQALTTAVRRGVKVKLLVDELATSEIDKTFFKPLIEAGGAFSWCLTVHPKRNRYFFNLRNHRKIQIIDGKIAFIGGMNIAKEYEGKDKSIGPWSDLQISIEGPILHELIDTFLADWAFATMDREKPVYQFHYDPETPTIPTTLIRSGPDSHERSFLKSFILFCNHAKERLDLFTPYFAPDDPMIMAVCLAAQRGVRVRLLIPTLNEHQYMVDLGRAFYETLLSSGVEIYELPDCVHHAKVCLADDEWIMVGSTNLDIRSIKLNFEIALVFPDKSTVGKLDEHYASYYEKSHRITLAEWDNRTFKKKFRHGFVRLFAPVL